MRKVLFATNFFFLFYLRECNKITEYEEEEELVCNKTKRIRGKTTQYGYKLKKKEKNPFFILFRIGLMLGHSS